MKFGDPLYRPAFGPRSLPVWEEWIEIRRRLPSCHDFRSLPVWEEWIEMAARHGDADRRTSLPVWEEWIEINLPGTRIIIISLFPYGKSGLKFFPSADTSYPHWSLPVWEEWIEIFSFGSFSREGPVSSRMGRVD